jgi:hypothetical protein
MKKIPAVFAKTEWYDVVVSVPDDVTVEHNASGEPYVVVMEPPLPGMDPCRVFLSMQVAAKRGLVKAERVDGR